MNKYKKPFVIVASVFYAVKLQRSYEDIKSIGNRINGTLYQINIDCATSSRIEWTKPTNQPNQTKPTKQPKFDHPSKTETLKTEKYTRAHSHTHPRTHNSAVTVKIYWNVNGTNGKNKYERLYENSPANNSIYVYILNCTVRLLLLHAKARSCCVEWCAWLRNQERFRIRFYSSFLFSLWLRHFSSYYYVPSPSIDKYTPTQSVSSSFFFFPSFFLFSHLTFCFLCGAAVYLNLCVRVCVISAPFASIVSDSFH